MSHSIFHPHWFFMSLALLAAVPALAQTDPTRPAPVWLALQPKVPGAAIEAEPATPGTQIIVAGPSRTFTMVDGQPVRPGETYKGSKLLGIGPDGVTWQTGGSRELSSMSPGVEKSVPAAHPPQPAGAKSRTKTINGGSQ
jgi:hypothetical protein